MSFCKGTKQKKEKFIPPVTAPAIDSVRKYYDDLGKAGGVLSPEEVLELELQKDFISSAVGLTSAVANPGRRNQIAELLSNGLGWKRMLWQDASQATTAGAIRETLIDRSKAAANMIKMIALEKNLPLLEEMWTKVKILAPDINVEKLQEVFHDQVVIGNLRKFRNISDSPIALEMLNQRLLKHKANLDEIGIPAAAMDELEKMSLKFSNTLDEMLHLAGRSGTHIERLVNGGYFPLQSTEEFIKIIRNQGENWKSGFKSVEESFQRERKTAIPVPMDLDKLASLLQKQLLGKELSEESAVLMSKADADAAKESAKKVLDKTRELEEVAFKKLDKDIDKAKKSFDIKTKREKARVLKLEKQKMDAKLRTIKANLIEEDFEPSDIKAVLNFERQKAELITEDILADIDISRAETFRKKVDAMTAGYEKSVKEAVQVERNKLTRETVKVLEHEQAKLALIQLAETPGEFSAMLSRNFSDAQMKNMFDGGILQQIPLMSDEHLEFYRGLDLGVRGLSDAIVLNPIQALKQYTGQLAKAVEEQNILRTAIDIGSEAGWVKASVGPDKADDYIKIGNSQTLAKKMGLNNDDLKDLYIHKTVANTIDSLIDINSSPHHLQQLSTAWGILTNTMKKSMLLGRNMAYISGVFFQNILAMHAGAGSLTQLPMALVDSMRFMRGKSWNFGSAEKVFNIAGKDYSVSELYREVIARRGGSTIDSLSDDADLFNVANKEWIKQSKERSKYFNSIYNEKFGDPISGVAKGFGRTFNTAYRALAFSNAFLDNAFRWATIRELATSGKSYDSLETLIRETDTYFAINADSGDLGNFTGRIFMPFAQFALNAPGAAVRHAIQHPWRMANTMQLYATAGQTDLTEAELPEWMRKSGDYFFTAYKDPDSGKVGVVMPQNIDFMLSSYEWFADLSREIAGTPRGVTNNIEKKREGRNILAKLAVDAMDKSYIGNAVLAAMGFNPRTLEQYSPENNKDTLLGIPMKKSTRELLTNLLPLTRSIDKALPPELVGQAPTRTTNPDTGLFTETDSGRPSIFGATPTSGGFRPMPAGTRFSNLLTAVSGLTITEIDPQANVIRTVADFDTQLNEVKSARNKVWRQILQTGETPERVEAFERLDKLAVTLLYQRMQVNRVALERGLKAPDAVNMLRSMENRMLNAPLKDRETLQLLQEYQELEE